MSDTTYIGCDPGMSGGIAWIRGGVACAEKMPDTDRDILDLFREIAREGSCFAMMERVGAFPGQGVTSCFTFGRGFGALGMAILAAGIPFELVAAGKWQKAIGCLTHGDKNISKAAAQRLFPLIKVTHALADALLIAEYARRTHV